MHATYSPDDNKLRLYAESRLDADDYARVKAAGFIWAPKQKLFVAPMWTPERADLLIEFCGDIEDEDTSLTERAEERAERFTDYRENRAADAADAHKAVSRIADGIPLGQPILVGHHSERRARKDAERIESGMRRAIKMWETSQYWKARAAGAIRHAKYKELPGVRHRRIKGLEADKRKQEKAITESKRWIVRWGALNAPGNDGAPASADLVLKRATYYANYSHISTPATEAQPYGSTLWGLLDKGETTPRAAQLLALKTYGRIIARASRWLAHINLRLDYERAMLGESGGIITTTSAYPITSGGRVLLSRRDGGEWLAVIRVNRSNGQINSVTTQAPAHVTWRKTWKYGIEEIKDYQPPTAEDIKAVKAAKKLPPLTNYNGPDHRQMTTDEFKRRQASGSACVRVAEAVGEFGAYRYRTAFKGNGDFSMVGVFLTDAKVVERPSADETVTPPPIKRVRVKPAPAREDAPAATPAAPATASSAEDCVCPDGPACPDETCQAERRRQGLPVDTDVYLDDLARVAGYSEAETEAAMQAMKDTLKTGVKVVSAPQLFPTPVSLARRMFTEAEIEDGQRVLEPEAGTGRLIDAVMIGDTPAWSFSGQVVAVEQSAALASGLTAKYKPAAVAVHCADFLTCNGNLGTFDRILQNPPFADGQDMAHVRHAYGFLRPGGRQVAIMGEGAFFREDRKAREFRAWLASVGGTSEPLPADTFKESGTGVRSRLVVISK